jgi:phosphate transport system permease protein
MIPNTAADIQPNLAPAGAGPKDPKAPKAPQRRAQRSTSSLLAYGEPMLWLTGGALTICLVMILALLALIFHQGVTTFWPAPLVQITTLEDRAFMGEVTREETFTPAQNVFTQLAPEVAQQARRTVAANDGIAHRRLVRIGNFELTGDHFNWFSDFMIRDERQPQWAVTVERLSWGRFYGFPAAFLVDGAIVADTPAEVWERYEAHHGEIRKRWRQRRHLETHAIGKLNRQEEAARLDVRSALIEHGRGSARHEAALERFEAVQRRSEIETARLREQINALNAENSRFQLRLVTADGQDKNLALEEIVRAFPANRLSMTDKIAIYLSRWWEFFTDDPREANSEGGVFPAIFGTVVMTLVMSLAVVPFGVLAALYLREYAKAGPLISAVRIAINNLAGVPSIVFGVFGLGFFCYFVGGTIDQLFFSAKLPSPTYGTGGILWASLTLALLTLPVVIVATEEALAAVPGSMREGSYACGASKWQTIKRIVLPRAMPGIMTGMILAMARGAGEVAPLMLVGAVKLAPELPVDGIFPFLHPERSFMHLGFHIFDLGFQSQNSEAAKPMVFTTTLLLIFIIASLNLGAVLLRNRLRKKFVSGVF